MEGIVLRVRLIPGHSMDVTYDDPDAGSGLSIRATHPQPRQNRVADAHGGPGDLAALEALVAGGCCLPHATTHQ